MSQKEKELIARVVEKVLKDFDYEFDDLTEAPEEVKEAIKQEIFENFEEEPPSVGWIRLVELDRADAHRNSRGDFLSA